MKHTRQFFALLLALVLTLGLCATAFADGAKPGSITISNPAQGKTYEVFKLLDVVEDESDLANKGFIYKPSFSGRCTLRQGPEPLRKRRGECIPSFRGRRCPGACRHSGC